MKISLSWLSEYLRSDKPSATIAEVLTDAGLEVGSIESTGVTVTKVVVAQVLESVQHPNADRLSVCKVDDGSGTPRQIVCGAKNYKVGDKIPLALPGAVLPGDFKIKVGKLRGVESEGMMCSSKEIGLGEGVDGLLILPPDAKPGTPIDEIFPTEEVFDIEITPNRPDWLGHLGVAREAAAFGCGDFLGGVPSLPRMEEDVSIASIVSPDLASFYSLRRIDNVKVGPSPDWLRRRLESVGLRSVNNVVDITNFVMFETGQPLHAFDSGRIDGSLTVRFAQEGEVFTALGERDLILSSNDPVVADAKGVQALAGIIGGSSSGVSNATTSVLLESAVFEKSLVRRSSRAHGISTDSSYRFERGAGAKNALNASARAAELIVGISGSTVSPTLVIAGSIPPSPIVALRCDRVRSLLGINLDDAAIAKILSRLGLTQVHGGWEIPFWRNDITREVDLIEEIARLHGIAHIVSRCSGTPSLSSPADHAYDFARGLRRRLSGGGFHEARSGTLTGSRNQSAFSSGGTVSVRNPMGEEHSTLRASLIPGLIDAVTLNLRHGAESIRFFEIGKVFGQASHDHSGEKVNLALLMSGQSCSPDWRGEAARSLDIFDLKGIVSRLGTPLERITFRPTVHAQLPLALEIMWEERPFGILGVLSPAIAREVVVGGHQGQIVVAELDLDTLQAATGGGFKDARRFKSIPRFPAVRRDLALLIDADTPYAVIEDSLLGTKEPLLSSVNPFDVFSDPEGLKVPHGKKSVAVALTFQHDDRTLTAEEVTEALGRIMARLRELAGAEIRG